MPPSTRGWQRTLLPASSPQPASLGLFPSPNSFLPVSATHQGSCEVTGPRSAGLSQTEAPRRQPPCLTPLCAASSQGDPDGGFMLVAGYMTGRLRHALPGDSFSSQKGDQRYPCTDSCLQKWLTISITREQCKKIKFEFLGLTLKF